MAVMEWFKVNGYNVIYGSLRLDPPMHQLIFLKLLAMASISRVAGTVCITQDVPYPNDVLAATIGVSEKELTEALKHHASEKQGRIKINDWGGIEVQKWAEYQSKSYLRVRKYREKKRKEKEENRKEEKQCNAPVTNCNAPVTKDVQKTNTLSTNVDSCGQMSTEVHKVYSLENVQNACYLNGIPENKAESYFHHYNSQSWKKGSGQPISNLRSHTFERWDLKKKNWDFGREEPSIPEISRGADGLTARERFLQKERQ